ncbi:polysaccharide biosynthesis protein [Brevibacterium luteolum]|uniref:polysaccharide biosynthesis protein n=1 Tax=Brevibacterium luteolum TaxID=199591 RepID=UPI00223BC7B3|nr:polysaccharide biosynthesis protein [Brevibacterium luteolum]
MQRHAACCHGGRATMQYGSGSSATQELSVRGRTLKAARRAFVDASIFVLFLWFLSLARYDLAVVEPNYTGILISSLLSFATIFVCEFWLRLRGRYAKASADELIATAGIIAVACGLIYVISAFQLYHPLVPLSSPVSAGAMTVLAIAFINWVRSGLRYRRRSLSEVARSALIIGAGAHGQLALRIIREDPREEYVAVGLLDDDPEKRHLRVGGVRVLGTLEDLSEIVDRTGAQSLVLAIPSLDPRRLDDILAFAGECGIDVRVISEFDGLDIRRRDVKSSSAVALRPGSFRAVELDDLIGRHAISTDVEAISDYIEGRTVLVTGAGGSIGSHLCSQLVRFAPGRLVMTDRDESGLHATELVLKGSASLTSENLILGDLRERHFNRSLIAEVKPDIVFHAAALKHLTFLERFPAEAVKTNVAASMDLLEAARDFGVESFVHISTDKAADPISTLGATKYVTERAVAAIARETGRRYMSVRFGNVLGSRGSVLGTFVTQVSSGGPVTVTAPGATRYFMTAAEACELVLQAGAIGGRGETLVLDMGDQVSIEDLARRVIALSGQSGVEIVYTGLRPGEKLQESRLARSEVDARPNHPLITQVPIDPIDLDLVREVIDMSVTPNANAEELQRALGKLVGPSAAGWSVLSDGRSTP